MNATFRRSLFAVSVRAAVIALAVIFSGPDANCQQQWQQLKFDAGHSGNAADRQVQTPLGLVGAVPLGDAVFTSPVVDQDHVYVVDGSGEVFCIDIHTLAVVWRTKTAGGAGNCNNVSSPVLAGPNLHVGTMAGMYYVLDRRTGAVVRCIDCQDPIFSAPVVVDDRVYFATLGSQVYAVQVDGTVVWTWDFVKEVIGFAGDRWSGEEWFQFQHGRVTWEDHFCCSRNLAAYGNTLVVPSGGRVVFIEDTGSQPLVRSVAEIPEYVGEEYPAAFGLSIGEQGDVYVQWHRRDNAGRVEVLRIDDQDSVSTTFVPGTETAIDLHGLLSFSSVSVRGDAIYRARPQEGVGLCRHSLSDEKPTVLPAAPSICSPVLLAIMLCREDWMGSCTWLLWRAIRIRGFLRLLLAAPLPGHQPFVTGASILAVKMDICTCWAPQERPLCQRLIWGSAAFAANSAVLMPMRNTTGTPIMVTWVVPMRTNRILSHR